jgi:hypothetical protein
MIDSASVVHAYCPVSEEKAKMRSHD